MRFIVDSTNLERGPIRAPGASVSVAPATVLDPTMPQVTQMSLRRGQQRFLKLRAPKGLSPRGTCTPAAWGLLVSDVQRSSTAGSGASDWFVVLTIRSDNFVGAGDAQRTSCLKEAE